MNYSNFVHLPALFIHLIFIPQAFNTVFLPDLYKLWKCYVTKDSSEKNCSTIWLQLTWDSFMTPKVPIPNWK